MDTPANGRSQPVVPTHYVYAFALALMLIAVAATAILFLMIEGVD